MFDRFDTWKYRDNANCWDYVREFLLEKTDIPETDIPKYGISPSDKKSMTTAANDVKKTFVNSEPVQFAIACHYVGRTIIHVGIVDKGMIRHTSRDRGTMKSSIKDFEKMSQKTTYKIHRTLCQR